MRGRAWRRYKNYTKAKRKRDIDLIDKYWNYSKKWTWTGTIGGSNVNVSCPKLSWE